MENDLKEQAQMFADDYKRIYGVELTVIHKSDEIIEKQEQQEVKVANGGNDESENNTEDI